jgi:hypothetical protein
MDDTTMTPGADEATEEVEETAAPQVEAVPEAEETTEEPAA